LPALGFSAQVLVLDVVATLLPLPETPSVHEDLAFVSLTGLDLMH
jgi:hypothetical protein